MIAQKSRICDNGFKYQNNYSSYSKYCITTGCIFMLSALHVYSIVSQGNDQQRHTRIPSWILQIDSLNVYGHEHLRFAFGEIDNVSVLLDSALLAFIKKHFAKDIQLYL